jgi:hypothetical protein
MKKCFKFQLFNKPNPFERMDFGLRLLFSKAFTPQKLAFCILIFCLLAFSGITLAQSGVLAPKNPGIENYSPILQFLASAELEGRETGTQGSYIAADYIATTMQGFGLKPFNSKGQDVKLSDYFQTFDLLKYSTANCSFIVKSGSKRSTEPLQVKQDKDFTVINTFKNELLESVPVIAGYGINLPELGYNDYNNIDAKGKLVVVLDGYPGQNATSGLAWEKFKPIAENDAFDLGQKCLEAQKQGAAAILVIDGNYLKSLSGNTTQTNFHEEDTYQDAEYFMPNALPTHAIPCIKLTMAGSKLFSEALGVDFHKLEQELAQLDSQKPIGSKVLISINLQVVVDTLHVSNILGVLPGYYTTQTVILGAHYDHLGKRGADIYYGSDDNASGVAGLLALAKMWAKSSTIPPYNIVFASWTAEEKGLIGSEYFTSSLAAPEKVKLYINMDMISRSVMEDTAQRQLSIGTRTTDENIREIARKSNATLKHPFELDFWDVTGHSGSDYASFTAKNIPIMTYNTGLHNDYHTPRDIHANADLIKMGNVLKVVNACLWEFLLMQ